MPSVKKGEKQSDYMARCVPMLSKEGKKHDQAVAQCLNMFREHWKAKGTVLPEDPTSEAFQNLLATFAWDDCPECVKMESDLNKKRGIFEIDMSAVAKVTTKCDNCKETIDTSEACSTTRYQSDVGNRIGYWRNKRLSLLRRGMFTTIPQQEGKDKLI
jgi:hypothetical protein